MTGPITPGSGYGYGDGTGYGYGTGYGHSFNDGSGYGTGYGYGSGNGSGAGAGYGAGDGTGTPTLHREFFTLAPLSPQRALSLSNAEMRRIAIECMGPDRFFAELDANVIHEDTDQYGYPRRLLRVPVADTVAGYLQAVEVVCPTTGRVYHLGVQPDVQTCQDAVASTFGMSGDEYQPGRET